MNDLEELRAIAATAGDSQFLSVTISAGALAGLINEIDSLRGQLAEANVGLPLS